jgi:hypothetical protein
MVLLLRKVKGNAVRAPLPKPRLLPQLSAESSSSQSHWDFPGKGDGLHLIREPGDLPSPSDRVAGRDASVAWLIARIAREPGWLASGIP